jgi:hypothetical protein
VRFREWFSRAIWESYSGFVVVVVVVGGVGGCFVRST